MPACSQITHMLVVATMRLRYRDLALMDALEKQVLLVTWLAALPSRLHHVPVLCLTTDTVRRSGHLLSSAHCVHAVLCCAVCSVNTW